MIDKDSLELIEVLKQQLIAEDVAWGTALITQIRGGESHTYAMINASHIPTTEGGTVDDRLNSLGDGGYTKIEADARFASISGSSIILFNVADAISPNHATNLYTVEHLIADRIVSVDQSNGVVDAGKLTALDSQGKLSITFHHIASMDDIIGNGEDGMIITSGQSHRDAVAWLLDEISTDEHDPIQSPFKFVKTKGDGFIDLTLLDIDFSFEAVGPWTPTAGDEYPPPSDAGSIFIIDGLGQSVGYTFVGGDLIGETAYDGDFLIATNQGWVLIERGTGSHVYYNVLGTVPLEAPLANAGHGLNQSGNIVAALEDITSGVTPRMSGYIIDAADRNAIIHDHSSIPGNEPSFGDTVLAELFINIADKKIYTVDGAGDSVLLGSATAEDSDRLGGLLPEDYAKINGDSTERFKVLDATAENEATNLKQVVDYVQSEFDDASNFVNYVPITRTINSKPLSTNIHLTFSDVEAASEDITINQKKFSDFGWNINLIASDVGATPENHPNVGSSVSTLGHIRTSFSGGRLDIWTS